MYIIMTQKIEKFRIKLVIKINVLLLLNFINQQKKISVKIKTSQFSKQNELDNFVIKTKILMQNFKELITIKSL